MKPMGALIKVKDNFDLLGIGSNPKTNLSTQAIIEI